jgi:hypothetical protein
MSGMEMLLINTLKAFMPKEAAEKIYRMVEDGTFDRIGEVPSDIAEIKRAVGQLHLGLATLAAHVSALEMRGGVARNPLSDGAERGPVAVAYAERGTDADAGSSFITSGISHNGHGGSVEPVGGIGE